MVTASMRQVASANCRVDIVVDERAAASAAAPTGVVAGGDDRIETLRLVVTDERSGELLLNEYLSPTAPYRAAGPTFHGFTDGHGFEYGLDFDRDGCSPRSPLSARRVQMDPLAAGCES